MPCPALQWWQLDFECISFALDVYLTTLFSDIFCFSDFFCDGTGHDRQTDIGTDRLFSENIILDAKEVLDLQVHPRCANAHNCLGLTLER